MSEIPGELVGGESVIGPEVTDSIYSVFLDEFSNLTTDALKGSYISEKRKLVASAETGMEITNLPTLEASKRFLQNFDPETIAQEGGGELYEN